jgi:hypothetical protein
MEIASFSGNSWYAFDELGPDRGCGTFQKNGNGVDLASLSHSPKAIRNQVFQSGFVNVRTMLENATRSIAAMRTYGRYPGSPAV